MTHDDDLWQRLRAHDPAADLKPAAPERVARLLEDTMSTDPTTRPGDTTADTSVDPRPAPRSRRAAAWLAAAAAVAVVGGAGFALTRDDDTPPPAATEPTVTSVQAPAAAPARCAAPAPELVSRAATAVDATVTAVDGDRVTLRVDTWYAGEPTDELVVQAPPASLVELIGAPDLQEGQRYLIAATDGQLMVCGVSGPYDADRAALYAAAFGG